MIDLIQGPNVFEKVLPDFSVDTLGYGPRRFKGCTLLHKMIGEGDLAGIMEKQYFLTERALNSFSCGYDSWSQATPLWMVVNWRGSSWLELVKMMVYNGADVNAAPSDRFTSCKSILGEAVKDGKLEIASYLLENGADPNGGCDKPLKLAGSNEEMRKLLFDYRATE